MRPNNVVSLGDRGPRQPKRPPRLYSPEDVSEMLGISYNNALRLCRVHGVGMGRRFYITLDQLDAALQPGSVTK